MLDAVGEIVDLTSRAFLQDDLALARQVEPLEQVIDKLKDELRTNHIARLQRGECSLAAGFVLSDLLTNLERVSDHSTCTSISATSNPAATNSCSSTTRLRKSTSWKPDALLFPAPCAILRKR